MNKQTRETLMSSGSGEWETPPEIWEPLNEEFNFIFDVCATPQTAKCEGFYNVHTHDALKEFWWMDGMPMWMNPPYGRGINKWVEKAFNAGGETVCLIPARTCTRWWHDYVMKAVEVRFVRGRIKFLMNGKRLAPAPFPSAIVVFRPHEGETRFSSWSPS